jgi:hypothetical protein
MQLAGETSGRILLLRCRIASPSAMSRIGGIALLAVLCIDPQGLAEELTGTI